MIKYKECLICKNKFKHRSNKIYCKRRCKQKNNKKKYLRHRKKYCEQCGFIPKHICQLDVDHINNNHKDNIVSNLQTLCANCHRLKTMLERKKNDKIVSSKT